MTKISFKTTIQIIQGWQIIHLPQAISQQLSSRGMVMAEITLNDLHLLVPLEPDGRGSHWFQLDDKLSLDMGLNPGDSVSLILMPSNTWLEPEVAKDILYALINNNLIDTWHGITIKARWAWIRWIRFTNNPLTREKRIKTTCSMLASGKKRPCCFDHSRCTETHVAKNGQLIEHA